MWASIPFLVGAAIGADEPEDQYRYLAGLAERGLHDLVVTEARAFLSEHGRHARADRVRFHLGEALFALDRFGEAGPEFERLDRNGSFEFALEVDFRRGQCSLELGDADAAEPAFEAVLAADEGYLTLPATFLLGEARLRSDEPAKAAERYVQVLAADPGGEFADDAAHGLVWCARAVGDHTATVAAAGQFLARFGDDARASEVWLLRGEAELELGAFEAALASYGQTRGATHAAASLRGRAFALAGLERHADAARLHTELLTRHGDSEFVAESALHRGIEWLRAEDPAQALSALDDPRCPGDSQTQLWRARALLASDQAEAALLAAERGLAGDPSGTLGTELTLVRADALLELGRDAEAAAVYANAGDAHSMHAAAVALLRADRPAEALALASRVVEAGGEYAGPALRVVAEALFASERWDEAAAALGQLAAASTDARERAELQLRAGWAQFEGQRFEAALEGFDTAATTAGSAQATELAAEALFMGGRAAEELGRPDLAAQHFDRLLESSGRAEFESEALLRRGRSTPGAEGDQYLERAIRGGGAFAARARFERAERRSERAEYEAAAKDYAALLASDPRAFEGSCAYGLAWCELALGRAGEAAGRLQALLADEGLGADLELAALELQTWAAREAGDADLARAAAVRFANASRSEDRILETARIAASALVEADRRDEAIELVASVRERLRDPQARAEAWVEQAWLALEGGALERAAKELERARALAPESPTLAEATFFLGEAHYDAGEVSASVAHYARAVQHAAPELAPNVLYKWGFACLQTGAHGEAAQHFAQLVEGYPKHELTGESLFLLGEARWRGGESKAAMAPLERVLEEHPRHAVRPKALFRLGVAAVESGAHQRASEVLSELASKHTDFEARAEAELWRGRALAELDRDRQARAALGRALEWDFVPGTDETPGGPTVISARARIELGKLAAARSELDAALSEFLKVAVLFAHEEEVAEALYRAGEVLEAQGNAAQARERFAEAASRFPETPFGDRARRRLTN